MCTLNIPYHTAYVWTLIFPLSKLALSSVKALCKDREKIEYKFGYLANMNVLVCVENSEIFETHKKVVVSKGYGHSFWPYYVNFNFWSFFFFCHLCRDVVKISMIIIYYSGYNILYIKLGVYEMLISQGPTNRAMEARGYVGMGTYYIVPWSLAGILTDPRAIGSMRGI